MNIAKFSNKKRIINKAHPKVKLKNTKIHYYKIFQKRTW